MLQLDFLSQDHRSYSIECEVTYYTSLGHIRPHGLEYHMSIEQLCNQQLKARKRVHIIHLQQQHLHVTVERIFTLDIYSYSYY